LAALPGVGSTAIGDKSRYGPSGSGDDDFLPSLGQLDELGEL
jgi:hypothetical protein